MNQFTKEQIAANKAEALNEMHSYVNALIPKLNSYLESTKIKIKVDLSLFAKNADDIRAIIAEGKPAKVRCYFKVASYEGCKHSIEFDTRYSVYEFGCAYSKGWMQLQDDETELLPCNYTGEMILEIESLIEKRKKDISDIEREISKAKRFIYN